jgi:murein DD-endopeptidase MepM/ murein hydrolase activator NlpD
MQEFDPRREPARYAPRVLAGVLGMMVLIAGWGGAASESRVPVRPVRAEPMVAAALQARQASAGVVEELAVAEGRVTGSLYAAAAQAGAPPALAEQAVSLFSGKLNVRRDLRPGDRFRLVFRRKVDGAGRTVSAGELLYAEVSGRKRARFYRFARPGVPAAEFFDAAGRDLRELLLRMPLQGARLTSGFGMRMHPLLGYTRMHKGVDLGAPKGTPVLAASDGVVEEARWASGYGRWLKIRHQQGAYETAYAHLSRWAVRPGQRVRQGQVIAYVGSSGESTGPHLHFEVLVRGRNVDPRRAKVPQGPVLTGRELAAFQAQKARMDRLVAQAPDLPGATLARLDAPGLTRIAMR